jgi:Tol biopolymer transport system component
MNRRAVPILAGGLLAALLLPAPGGERATAALAPRPPVTNRVSLAAGGLQPFGGGSTTASAPAISADGSVVAFASDATDLVPGDTNGTSDVFVFNRRAGTTTRVSVGPAGAQASGPSFSPAISADGRVVAFASAAPDLVAGDTNHSTDVFVHDLATGITTRVSHPTGGTQAAGDSDQPALSGDGSVVVFTSTARDMVADDHDSYADVFRHDRASNTTKRVSIDRSGGDPDGDSTAPDVSVDGKVIAFASDASDLIASDSNGTTDVFVSEGGIIERVDVGTPQPSGGPSFSPSLSGDGKRVAFASDATNLVQGDTNGKTDIFLFDRLSGSTTRVSVAGDGTTFADGGSTEPAVSANGQFVSFTSDATNLLDPGADTNGAADVFGRDLTLAKTTRESVGPAGAQATQRSSGPEVSSDGGVVAFVSSAPEVAQPPARIGSADAYVRDRAGGVTTRISGRGGGEPAGGPFGSTSPALAGGGRVVAFASFSPDLVPGDTNGASDVFVRDSDTGLISRVSVDGAGGQADGASTDPAISADGRYVAFTSTAANLVPDDTNGVADVFVHDRVAGTTARVSLPGGSGQFDVPSGEPAMSADGTYVAFVAGPGLGAAGPAPSGSAAMTDVYVRHRRLGLTLKISGTPDNAPADGPSRAPVLAGDGQTVAFSSVATNLVPGDTNRVADVFVARFTVTGEGSDIINVSLPTIEARVSVASSGAQASGPSTEPSLSADGRFVAFTSEAPDLVAGDSNGLADVFVHDRVAKTTARVSTGPGGAQVTGASREPSMSGDGRSVAFTSDAPDLTGPAAGNPVPGVFLRDLAGGLNIRVSALPNGAAENGSSRGPALAADSRAVAFSSDATNLAAADTNSVSDVFVRDARPDAGRGYWLVASDGGVFAYGQAGFFGSAGSTRLNRPIVAAARAPSGGGYWFVASDGGVFSFGDAPFAGSMGAVKLNAPIVGLTPTPTGRGYWLVASDGGIFSFGDARFLGSTGGKRLNRPIVAMVPTPTGGGYWLVASDGGIFSFGDARFFGSAGGIRLNQPIVAAGATPTGLGYRLVASDGGIFTFGDAKFLGSTGGTRLNRPIVGMASSPSGYGYWLVASDGGIFSFGDARFAGSAGATRLNAPIIGLAAL